MKLKLLSATAAGALVVFLNPYAGAAFAEDCIIDRNDDNDGDGRGGARTGGDSGGRAGVRLGW